jgi:multicomponent K+:H+ antiporter subunit D
MTHLPILPVVVPLVAGALMLLLRESQRGVREALALAAVLIHGFCAVMLLRAAGGAWPELWPAGIVVYLPGGWPAPFGIVLVVDQLAAVMVGLTSLLGIATLVYSLAHWDRVGVHFHTLFQFLLMGLSGAFMTGDLFNLFVFFEVLLAASYGLLLHGSGVARVRAGLHYIAINLAASFLFLLGVALIYAMTGTLNMADLVGRVQALTEAQRTQFSVGIALLAMAFLVKAGVWPFNFWLPSAYTAAAAPVAAMFAIMTKVGVYALVRLDTLLAPAGVFAPLGGEWMVAGGLATLGFATLGLLAAQQLDRVVAYCVLMSSGIVLTAFGLNDARLNAPALFYMVSSVIATGAFFLLVEMVARSRVFGADLLAVSFEAFGVEDPSDAMRSDDVVGIAIPAAMAFLGLAFVSCALLVTGMPPLSGFVGKFAILSAAIASVPTAADSLATWAFVAMLLLSGLAGVVTLCRIGMRSFWGAEKRSTPRLRVIEAGPVAVLVMSCVLLSAAAGPVLTYLEGAAASLGNPQGYIDAVMAARPDRAGIAGAKP